MKQRTSLLVMLFVIAPLLCSQSLKRPTENTEKFRWNLSTFEELSAKDALSRSKKLTTSQKDALIRLIASDIADSTNSDVKPSLRSLRKLAGDARIKIVDLNGDGHAEVIAQAVGEIAGCSPTGNCPLWVFEQRGNVFKELLSRDGTQLFSVQSSRTNGYRDLLLGMHGSAFDRELHIYRYRDGSYQEAACFEASWMRVVNGQEVDLKQPDITPCGS